MKKLKEYQIIAEVIPSGRLIFESVLAFNLRDAWYFFKWMNTCYTRLRFNSAKTEDKNYSKLY